jgi:hypothetical protein
MRLTSGLFIATAVFCAQSAAAFNIDTCGQTIGDRDIGVLTADLSGPPATTVVHVSNGATLDMNGHSIDVPNGWAVWCEASAHCIVIGGGIAGAFGAIRNADTGIYVARRARVSADSVSIENSRIGIQGEDWNNGRSGAGAKLSNVRITGSEGAAILLGNVKANNVTIEDNPGDGIIVPSLGTVRGRGLTVQNNAFSAGCDDYGCEGIEAGEVKGANLNVIGNGGFGIKAQETTLRNSTVVDNIRAGQRRDIVSFEEPQLHKVACGTSFSWESQGFVHWGVCALDDAN